MSKFVRRTFDNSYLFTFDADLYNTMQKELLGFITTAERIDKNSEAFAGIIDSVKRNQTTSVLYSILMMDNVVLCISKNNNKGLASAFKVFEAKDLRSENKAPKVFIDVTGLIKYNNGYYTCQAIDKFITYIFDALGYLLYSKATIKLLNNSTITMAGTECYVAMFTYILDYLRIVGYSQSKEKISYLTALYFMYHLMDKELDGYCKNIAAKVAGISTSDTRAFELYYDAAKDFANIDSFINLISSTFKLKGLTTETFVHRWAISYQNGTQYGTELFTSFMTILIGAYCGSYVINHKQIERCCGASMVKFVKELGKLGSDEFDRRAYMSESAYEATLPRDKATMELRESFLNRDKLPEEANMTSAIFESVSDTKKANNAMIRYFEETVQSNKISKQVRSNVHNCLKAMKSYCETGNGYQEGVLSSIINISEGYINSTDKRSIISELNDFEGSFEEANIDIKKRYNSCLIEVRKVMNML